MVFCEGITWSTSPETANRAFLGKGDICGALTSLLGRGLWAQKSFYTGQWAGSTQYQFSDPTSWQLNILVITASSSWIVSGQELLFCFLMCSLPPETLQISSSLHLVSSFGYHLLITFLSKSGSQFFSLHYKSLVFPKLPLYCPSFFHLLHLCFLIFCYCWVNSHFHSENCRGWEMITVEVMLA